MIGKEKEIHADAISVPEVEIKKYNKEVCLCLHTIKKFVCVYTQ